MHSCNTYYRRVLALIVGALCLTGAFSQQTQTAPALPSMPTLTMPSMPTISAPTMSNGFYTPGARGQTAPEKQDASSLQADSRNANAASPTQTVSETNSLLNPLSALTASDIQALSNQGLLNAAFDTGMFAQSGTASQNGQTNALLQQVLSELEQLKQHNTALQEHEAVPKNQQGTENPESDEAPLLQQSGVATPASRTSGSRMIRFSVNGYDILHTCRTIYISDVQSDGTFLVTGDRRYVSDGKTRSETFHLLFKRAENEAGVQNYTAAAAVTQDYMNEYSFLYQLSQRPELTALRTGNLVTMRTEDPNWKLEMLIDLGNK